MSRTLLDAKGCGIVSLADVQDPNFNKNVLGVEAMEFDFFE